MPNIVPQVPEQFPGQSIDDLPLIANPLLGVWFATRTVTNVPENVMGWLVAQGYEVTGITQDTTTVPPTNYFALTRQAMDPIQTVITLCNSYTTAANRAFVANQTRYNDIVNNWTEMIATSHDQFDLQTDEQNAQAGVFMADLDEYMTAIETLIDDNRTQMVTDAAEAKVALEAMDARLADLETNAAANAVTIGTLLTEQDTNLSTYISSYDNKLTEMDQNATAHIAAVLAEANALDAVLDDHVTAYSSQFDLLAANYTAHLADIDALLVNVSANVTTFVADVSEILNLLDSDYETVSADLGAIRANAGTLIDNHVLDYQVVLEALATDYAAHAPITRGVIDSLSTDYTTHVSTATAFLTGLGTTDLARINEEFASKLSVQLQQLVTNGLSTSTLITDITERNHRDRDEQIQMLNDRLMREKFDNQHRLYEQQRSMRAATVDNQHRLYEQQLGMRTRTMDALSQLHSVRQEVLKYQASLISGVHALLQDVRTRTLSGKQAILAAKDANERLGIEVQSQLYARLQDVRQRTIESLDRIYQLRDVFAKWSITETHKRYEQLQQVEQLFVDCIQRQLAAKQEVTRGEMSQRDALLQQLQSALTALLGGKERFSTLLMQIASTLSEHKHKAIVERMNAATKRLEGWKSVADDNRKLMMYQLDERNKLLIGLYGFVKDREDLGPEWQDAARMIAGLGDSSGGWLQP